MILQSLQLLANFAERQKSDSRIIDSPAGNRVHRVGDLARITGAGLAMAGAIFLLRGYSGTVAAAAGSTLYVILLWVTGAVGSSDWKAVREVLSRG